MATYTQYEDTANGIHMLGN